MNAILMLMLAAETAAQAPPDVLLLDFTASYCAPCQQMLPVLQRMEDDGYPIRRIDITEHHDLSRQYNVERIPTLILLVEGREVRRFQGLTAEQELRDEMRRAARQLSESRAAENPPAEVPQTAEATPPARPAAASSPGNGQRRSIADVFKGMFQTDGANGFEHPTVRAQNPEGTADQADALAVPAAATVRVRVTGDKLQDVGTGTIVHSTSGQSIILTCAHLFQGPGKSAQIEIDVFQNGETRRYPATLVGGNHDSDLAVLKIQNADALPAVPLPQQPSNMQAGQQVVSFGCDNGRPPTRLTSRILKVNQYHGPSNLTCEKDPVQGRSGGGLFDEKGQLLAVCSAADRGRHEGLYMSQPAIMTLLNQLKLDFVLQTPASSPGEDASLEFVASQNAPDALLEQLTPDPSAADNAATVAAEPDVADPFREVAAGATAASAAAVATAATAMPDTGIPTAAPGQQDTEVTVLIDSHQPGVGKRVIVIPKATPWLLELLTGEAASAGTAAQLTTARRPTVSHR